MKCPVYTAEESILYLEIYGMSLKDCRQESVVNHISVLGRVLGNDVKA